MMDPIKLLKENKMIVFGIIGAIGFYIYSMNPDLLFPLILFAAGIGILAKSADSFMAEAPGLIHKMGLPAVFAFVIGLALATSLPEIMVTGISAFHGVTDQAVGNIVGSNMLNLFILALAATIGGALAFKKDVESALIGGLVAVILLWFLTTTSFSALTIGIILLVTFGIYMYWIYRRHPISISTSGGDIGQALIGFLGLAGGSYAVVYAAEKIGGILGWEGSTIGIILLAFATNVPEFTVLIISFVRRQVELGLGGIVGSNVVNITIGLGVASLFAPLNISPRMALTVGLLVVFSLMALVLYKSGKQLTRKEALFMAACYIAFVWWNLK